MKIQYASDLHLEFPENKDFLKYKPLKKIGDILLLAGDIVPFAVLEKHRDFFSYLSDNFEDIYWIPGNHEYYYFDLKDRSSVFHEKLFSNVHLLNNTVVHYNDFELICSTLWSNINPANEWKIFNGLNDFRLIKDHGNDFSIMRYNQLHQKSVDFISNALDTAGKKSIVLTHHAPTLYNYPDKYKGSALNDAFAVELFDLIDNKKPTAWVYGHTHSNTDDFSLGETRVVTNQLGYVKYNEHHSFSNIVAMDI